MPDVQHVAHAEPVWRERANYIIQVSLEGYGMQPGALEQLWTRTQDQQRFEVCCLPFFTYGIALGDEVTWTDGDRQAVVASRSGRRLIRCAFDDPADGERSHEDFHGALVASGALVEFLRPGYVAIDIDSPTRLSAVLEAISPLHESGRASWEWASE